jgi:hypothetical protein
MNAARQAIGITSEFRSKMAKAGKKRWKAMPAKKRKAHMAAMRAARKPGYGNRAWVTRRRRQESPPER